ncbi:MAG: hypothetical protein ACXVKL_17320 [Candidatus Angelobacter sp.]
MRSCTHFLQKSLSFAPELKPQHGIICVPDDDHVARRFLPPPLVYPEIEKVGRDES